jgi:hypothetical protein
MNKKRIIINFSSIQDEDKNNIDKKIIVLPKLNFNNEQNTRDISKTEIDSSLKKCKQKKESSYKKKEIKNLKALDISKNIKLASIATLPNTINSSNKNIKYFHKNSYLNNIFNIENNSNNETKTEKGSKHLYINIATEPNKKKIDINSLLVNKNISNIHPYKQSKFKKRESSKNSKNLSIDYYNAFQCIFCEQFFKGNEISKLIKCSHKFCEKCGEQFYFDLINNGYTHHKFKCPYFKCQKEISYNIIELLLSTKNFDTLKINQFKQDKTDNEITNRNFIYREKENTNDIEYNNYCKYSIKKRNDKISDNKYILDINNLNSDYIFYLQIKKIFILCPKCGQNTLYRKASNYFLKCLNCKNKFCKFCIRLLTDNHFDTDNLQRCKVYFRITNYSKKTFSKKFFKQIFLMIAGFLFLMSYFIIKMKGIYKHKKEYSNIIKIIIYLFYFILCIILFPILIIIMPYYPIISCL